MFTQAKERIREEINILVEISAFKQDKSQRNSLNKWFQDSVKNYFLEVYAAPLIMKELKMTKIEDVKQFIHSQVKKSEAKFMLLIENYHDYMVKFNKIDEFIAALTSLVLTAIDNEISVSPQLGTNNLTANYFSYNKQKTIRKQFVGLLLHQYCLCRSQNKPVTSFYDLWNYAFPKDQKHKKKLSKYDTQRIHKNPLTGYILFNEESVTCRKSPESWSEPQQANQSPNLTRIQSFKSQQDSQLKTLLKQKLYQTHSSQQALTQDLSPNSVSENQLGGLLPRKLLKTDETTKGNNKDTYQINLKLEECPQSKETIQIQQKISSPKIQVNFEQITPNHEAKYFQSNLPFQNQMFFPQQQLQQQQQQSLRQSFIPQQASIPCFIRPIIPMYIPNFQCGQITQTVTGQPIYYSNTLLQPYLNVFNPLQQPLI